jgi:hypothetical protein
MSQTLHVDCSEGERWTFTGRAEKSTLLAAGSTRFGLAFEWRTRRHTDFQITTSVSTIKALYAMELIPND